MLIVQKWQRFWSQYRASYPSTRKIWYTSLVLLPLLHLSLRLFGLRKVQTALARWQRKTPSPPTHKVAKAVARPMRAIYLATLWPFFSGNCLSRSLLLWWLLLDAGIESDLRIGVRHFHGRLNAHAWIEYQGVPLNENADIHTQYSVFHESINLSTARFK
jgi:hypothetical protein